MPGIGPSRFHRLLERCGDAHRTWRASEAQLLSLLEKRCSLDLKTEMERLRRLEVEVLSVYDAGYPQQLKEVYGPPALLYVKGKLRPQEQGVGVVGTRVPTPYGKELAARIVPELAQAGLTVVSGMARGIDSIAVLGSGIDVIYPAEDILEELDLTLAVQQLEIKADYWHSCRVSRFMSMS